ncbi:uncharacterized protein [Palaemon carinicauda]|uniref:uncharacterized protein n=1 Tax=Palaemon carinicauda TaxID=392227 RepID=UPI0035B6A5CC
MAERGHQIMFRGKTSVAWKHKDGPYSLLLSLVDYRVFHKIAKNVHLHEVERIQQSKCFPLQRLGIQKTTSHLLYKEKDLELIWYDVVNPKETTNVYGNVSFVLDMVKFMNYCQHSFNIYYVESVDFKTCNVSHILFTKKRYDYLTEYDPTVFGGPWYTDPVGKHYCLKNARRLDGRTNINGHRLEFMLEFEQDDAFWLYKESSVPIAVDHQEARVDKRHICLRNCNVPCPSPFNRKQMRDLLVAQGLTQLEDEVPSDVSFSVSGEEATSPSDTQQRQQPSGVLSRDTNTRRCLF